VMCATLTYRCIVYEIRRKVFTYVRASVLLSRHSRIHAALQLKKRTGETESNERKSEHDKEHSAGRGEENYDK